MIRNSTRLATMSTQAFPLDKRAIHAWPFELFASPQTVEKLLPYLSEAERQRASRHQSGDLRAASILRSGMVDIILGPCLGIPPRSVEFEFGSTVKPDLRANLDLQFNLSHSGCLAILVVCQECELEVDVERITTHPGTC